MSDQEKPMLIIPETGHISQDPDREQPQYVAPGSCGNAPSDATVLFDGTNLDQWRMNDGSPAVWKVEDGYAEVIPGTGNIFTKEKFGSVQLHLEFASPTEIEGNGQSGEIAVSSFSTTGTRCRFSITMRIPLTPTVLLVRSTANTHRW
tara:strand:- start:10145 stop:10588 length:444 start_codon:yes stop_codon:yes gene_type:complete